MTRYLKSTAFVFAGFCWIAFALFLCLFLYAYLAGGAGLQIFGFMFPVSSVTAVVGLIHFIGFSAAALLSFSIGVWLCAHGFVPAPETEKKVRLIGLTDDVEVAKDPTSALRCVRCRGALGAPVDLCPDCGWTQPGYDAGRNR